MAKARKIKHYGSIYKRKRRPRHPLVVLLGVLGVFALVAVGYFSYEPLYNAIMEYGKESPESSVPPSGPEPDALPETEAEASAPEPEKPAAVRTELHAKYMPFSTAADPEARGAFLSGLAGSYNTVMVDLKDSAGTVLYQSALEQVGQWQVQSGQAYDLSQLVKECQALNIQVIGRLYSFEDHLAPRGDNGTAFFYQGSNFLWLDNTQANGGRPWMNPYSQKARDYLSALQREAVTMGVETIVLDGVAFPYNAVVYKDAELGQTDGKSYSDILAEYVSQMTRDAQEQGARVYLYLPSKTVLAEESAIHGGDALSLSAGGLAAGILPASFEAGYTVNGAALANPAGDPYGTTKAVLTAVRAKAQAKTPDTDYLAFVQDGLADGDSGQLKALEELNCPQYVVYPVS